MSEGAGKAVLTKVKSYGAALFFLFLGVTGLVVPIVSLFRLFTTGELLVVVPWKNERDMTGPFTLDYFVSLMDYTLFAIIGVGSLNAAFAYGFGLTILKTFRPDRLPIFYVAPALVVVVFILPIIASVIWL